MILNALAAQGETRMRLLEEIVDKLVQMPLAVASRDGIMAVLRTEYQLAKAHVVMADEPTNDQGVQAWQTQSTQEQLRQLMGSGLLRPEKLVDMMQRLGPPPKWKLDPATGYPKRVY